MELKKIKNLIAIVGPTASGKTGLAVFLAKKLNGEIVSADSRQIYRGLDIGTGKDLAEYGNVKYHLIDICEPEEKFTMFDWLARARLIIEDMFSRGKLPIIVGGTGLYVQALIEGYQITNNSKLITNSHNLKLKTFSREELEEMTLPELQRLAKKIDSAGFKKIDHINPIRLIRHIERAQSGEQMTKKKPDFEVLQIGVDLPREELYKKIDHRVDSRFNDGMLGEVDGLLQRGVDPEWLIKLGLEYRIITEYLIQKSKCKNQSDNSKLKISNKTIEQLNNNSKILHFAQDDKDFDEMKQRLKFSIHTYARRQLTWFRRFPKIKWVKNKKEALEIAKEFVV